MKTFKKYLPDPKTIPAILVIGGIGGVVLGKMVPGAMAKVASFIPTVGSGSAG